jgi:uncharacterized protein YbcI
VEPPSGAEARFGGDSRATGHPPFARNGWLDGRPFHPRRGGERGGREISDPSKGPDGTPHEGPSDEQVREEISREILQIHEESYGRGAGRAEVMLTKDFVVVVLDDIQLLPNEQFLVENGRHEAVLEVRTNYQHAIRSSFSAAIERATGRTVAGFASTTSLEEPRFMAEIFRLE